MNYNGIFRIRFMLQNRALNKAFLAADRSLMLPHYFLKGVNVPDSQRFGELTHS